MSDFTDRLEELLKGRNLTQANLADILNIRKATISEWKRNSTYPAANIALKIAKTLNTSVEYLLTGNKDFGTELIETEKSCFPAMKNFDLFKLSHGEGIPVKTTKEDSEALILLPVFSQAAAAGKGQQETQLQEIDKFVPILFNILGSSNPEMCGICRVVGDSMEDINLFNGDWVIFDKSQTEGNGVFVIGINSEVRVKRLEYRAVEKKIVIRSENSRCYPMPEVISYEQADNLLIIYGKVISWFHRHIS